MSRPTAIAICLLLAACSTAPQAGDTVRAACHDAQPFLQAAALARPSAAAELVRLCAWKTGSPEQVRQQTEILIQALYSPI